MSIIEKIRQFKKAYLNYKPLIEVFIYKQHLLDNLSQYQKHYPNLQFAPVLKANAYGHGLEQVSEILKGENLPFVCVDSLFELKIVEKFAPKLEVLVLGFTRTESVITSNSTKTVFTIMSLSQLQELSKNLHKPKKFHLKLDTGLHRQGILPEDFSEAVQLIGQNPNILVRGVFSHFGDPYNETSTLKQIETFNKGVKFFTSKFSKIKYTHLSATEGVGLSSNINANLVRLGIGFYGITDGLNSSLNLKPALEVRSIITGVKIIQPQEAVGYGFTFTASKAMALATVPVGYFEGIDRRLSNKGFLSINGEFSPLVGRVSMNLSTLDISQNKNAKFGDVVVIISPQTDDKNSVANIAKLCETLERDILVHIPVHLKRTIV